MKIWMSGEVQSDVADDYRKLRKEIEQSLNAVFSGRDYGAGLAEWDVIAMIFGDDGPKEYKEVKKYNKRDKSTEFRLRIDYQKFKHGDDAARRKLILDVLDHSLSILDSMKIPDIDIVGLRRDVQQTAKENGWI